MDILRSVDRSSKVKIGDVEAIKPGSWERQDTLEYQLDKFQRGSVGTKISGVVELVATYRDAGAVGVGFWWADKTENLVVGDLPPML